MANMSIWFSACFRARHIFRAAEVRQELPATVDQLPARRGETGEHLQGGGRPHRQAPCHTWQQVPAHIRVSTILMLLLICPNLHVNDMLLHPRTRLFHTTTFFFVQE
jgi:hypothetical protein